jgi:phosphoribosylglycinamide formyltransferase-1
MKLGILVSGGGTNLQALLDAEARGELAPGEIAIVISNRPGVPALARAERVGKRARVVDHRQYADRTSFEDAVLGHLTERDVEAVVLAGFMRLLTPHFIDRFPQRIVNTHPSLLPAFPGVDAAAQAITYGVKVTGCTIHFVDSSIDGGPIIAQATVPVLPDDDPGALQARIQRQEHRLLPEVVQRLAAGRLSCQGRRVIDSGSLAH